MKKTFVLDTNVLLLEPDALFYFGDNIVVITEVVLEELNKFKSEVTARGECARKTAEILDELRQIGDLLKGVRLENGGILRVEMMSEHIKLPVSWDKESADNRILQICAAIAERGENIFLVTKDAFRRIKANVMGIVAQDVDLTSNVVKTIDDIIEKDLANGNKVFIIHGHDNEMKREVQLLLNRAELDDVVLHECPDKGRTIVEKLIEESQDAGFAIALLSPDDLLEDGIYRARQNVILEIGYFMGKLGKERVLMLKKGEVEIPSDLQGLLYKDFDNQGAWKTKLIKEINAAGIEVDFAKVLDRI
jgi:predicted nucleotide-binding protein